MDVAKFYRVILYTLAGEVVNATEVAAAGGH